MYLDPGFGSMLVQVVIASLAAGAAMLAIFRNKVAAFFRGRKRGGAAAEEDAPASGTDSESGGEQGGEQGNEQDGGSADGQ